MYSRIDVKQRARAEIGDNLGILFLCVLVYFAIIYMVSLITFFTFGLGVFIVAAPFALGNALIYLDLTQGIKPTIERLFHGFKRFGDSIALYLLISVFTFLWSMLLIVPGIIKGISYSMGFYILADNPSMTGLEAMNESKRIMEGHKMDYFVLQLSFIPWILLAVVTCGIGIFYVEPYVQSANANFYLAIKQDELNKM